MEGVVVSDSDSMDDSDHPNELEEGEFVPELDIRHLFQEPYDFQKLMKNQRVLIQFKSIWNNKS